MAIDPSSEYGAQVDTSSDPSGYPYGQARNISVAGDGTGTPLEKKWLSDLWGFFQNILSEGSVTPSGTPDKVGASQYMTALKSVFYSQTDADTEIANAQAAAEANAATYTDDEIDDHVALSIYSSGGTTETNIDNITSGQVTGTVTMIGDRAFATIVTVFYHVPYTATGAGLKSVRIAQPGGVYDIPGTFSAAADVVGSGTATHGLATDIAPVRIRAVATGTEIELAWTSSASSGTGIVSGSFSYVRPAS